MRASPTLSVETRRRVDENNFSHSSMASSAFERREIPALAARQTTHKRPRAASNARRRPQEVFDRFVGAEVGVAEDAGGEHRVPYGR
jgi:hypothetical protein